MHSTDALSLPEVPKRLLVVGAGAIGLELGSVWRRLGAEVTRARVPGPHRARAWTPAAAKLLQRALERQGMTFRFGVSAKSARVEGDVVHVEVVPAAGRRGGRPRPATCCSSPWAAGPSPRASGASEAGVALDARGRIEVDDALRSTNVPGICAIGDVIAGPMLAHKAEEEGVACVERMAGIAGHVNYDASRASSTRGRSSPGSA